MGGRPTSKDYLLVLRKRTIACYLLRDLYTQTGCIVKGTRQIVGLWATA